VEYETERINVPTLTACLFQKRRRRAWFRT